MLDRLTDKARTVFGEARREAAKAQIDRIETPHILLALSAVINTSASDILKDCGLDYPTLQSQIDAHLKRGFKEGGTNLPFSLHMKSALDSANVTSKGGNISTLHLLWGLLDPQNSACNAQQSFELKTLERVRVIVERRIQMGSLLGDASREWDVAPPLRDATYLLQDATTEYSDLETAFLKETATLLDRESLLVLMANLQTKIQILEKLIVKASQQADLGELPRLTKMLTNLEKKDVGTN